MYRLGHLCLKNTKFHFSAIKNGTNDDPDPSLCILCQNCMRNLNLGSVRSVLPGMPNCSTLNLGRVQFFEYVRVFLCRNAALTWLKHLGGSGLAWMFGHSLYPAPEISEHAGCYHIRPGCTTLNCDLRALTYNFGRWARFGIPSSPYWSEATFEFSITFRPRTPKLGLGSAIWAEPWAFSQTDAGINFWLIIFRLYVPKCGRFLNPSYDWSKNQWPICDL